MGSHTARGRCLLHRWSRDSVLFLVVVADDEEDAEADECETSYAADDTTNDGANGGR